MTYQTIEEIDKKFRELTEPQHQEFGLGRLLNSRYEDLDPVIIESASGPYLHDIMGHRYIDIGMGSGSLILGHAHQPVVDKVVAQAAKGSLFVQPARPAYLLKQKILEHMPEQYSGVIFCNSGSEATMRAIRLARAFSNRSRIGVFSGGWHGSHDAVLAGDDYDSPETSPSPKPLSSGIPTHLLNDILMLPYNKTEAFDLIRREARSLALVMIEPIQGSNPRSDIGPFLAELVRVCGKNDVLVAFDESITGYRLGIGGGIEYFGLAPDIVTYGKILGGGLPIGAVVCSKTVASHVFDTSSEPFFTGGTFSANPMTMQAGIEVLHCLNGLDYKYINDLSGDMRQTCDSYFVEKGLPIRMAGCTSVSRLIFTDKPVKNKRARDRHELPESTQSIFRKLMILHGVFYPSNGIIFLSFAHKEDHVTDIVSAIIDTVAIMKNLGFLRQN